MDASNKSKIPKNVNDYKHLLQVSLTNQKDLEWYMHLRNYTATQACNGEHLKITSAIVDIKGLREKAGLFAHLCTHRLGTAVNPSQLEFETSLRDPVRTRTSREATTSLPPLPSTRSKSPMDRRNRLVSRGKGENHATIDPYSDLQVSVHSHELTHLFIPGATQETLRWNMSLRASQTSRPVTQTIGKKPNIAV